MEAKKATRGAIALAESRSSNGRISRPRESIAARARASELDEEIGIGGPVALQEQCLYQIPILWYPREETDESPCIEQETELQDRSSQDRPSEAKIYQKMCVFTWGIQPWWPSGE